MPPPPSRNSRRRSRYGCSNCKLRRVKCDERKPCCANCRKAHIACSYSLLKGGVELRSFHEEMVPTSPSISRLYASSATTLSMMNMMLQPHRVETPGTIADQLGPKDLEHLHQFQNTTVRSFGTMADSAIYKTEFARLSTSNPFLLHAAITCTAMHLRFLTGQVYAKRTPFEAYHWASATSLFNRELSRSIRASDSSALWMAAVMIGFSTCFAVDTELPEELWPIARAPSVGISWFRVQKGVRTFYDMLGPDSPFTNASQGSVDCCLGLPEAPLGAGGIPQVIAAMCGLDEHSTAQNNVYHTAAHAVSTLLADADPGPLRFLAFVNGTEARFQALFEQKDPRALVLMAIWYGLIPVSAWWIWARAQLERKAVRMFLDLHYKNDVRIQNVLAAYVSPTSAYGDI